MTLKETILAEVEAFLSETGMTPGEFGRLALNDTAFVTRLRAGADPRVGTVDRLRAFMEAHRPLGRRAKRPRAEVIASAA